MDNEDPGKKSLGSELYKQANLNVDSSMRSRISSQTAEQPITRDESNLVNNLLPHPYHLNFYFFFCNLFEFIIILNIDNNRYLDIIFKFLNYYKYI